MAGLRHILVKDLVLHMQIGVYNHEKGRTQRARINLDLSVLDTPSDDHHLSSVVDYCVIVNKIRAYATSKHVNLVETLAEQIATICFEDNRVRIARVRVEKLDAIADAEGAGVEIERTRS
jgi:dihydroneopterin aldolase